MSSLQRTTISYVTQVCLPSRLGADCMVTQMREMRNLVKGAQPGDHFTFNCSSIPPLPFFLQSQCEFLVAVSGHGDQVGDTNGDEQDELDEGKSHIQKNDRLTQLSVGLLAVGQYLEILTAKITHDFFKVAYLYENWARCRLHIGYQRTYLRDGYIVKRTLGGCPCQIIIDSVCHISKFFPVTRYRMI